MTHPSWGPGWPDCQSGRIVDLDVDGTRFPGGVRAEVAELVTMLVRECRVHGYTFGVPGDPSYGCWGYNCRPIAGTGQASNHSWGLAIDVNAPSNPQRWPLTTDMPDWMPDLWATYGWRWGGDYVETPPDPMHYEFVGSVDDAAEFTFLAALDGIGVDAPAPSPSRVGLVVGWP